MLRTALLALALMAGPVMADPNQPRAHIVEGHGSVPLVVQEWGNPDGPPILFIHGFSFGANAFKHQIGEIATTHRLIALDLRGHGFSAKPWTEEAYTDRNIWATDIGNVLAALKVQKPVIVGWSFGGFVAMNYLRACGADCARGLVLAGSLAGLVPLPPPGSADKEAMAKAAEANKLPAPKGNARVDNYHEVFDAAEWLGRVMTWNPPPPHEQLQKQMTVTMMAPMIRRAMGKLQLDNKDMPEKLTLPVLFIHGLQDGSVPADKVTEAVQALPDARAIGYAETGHSPFAEQPARFNADLMAFAKSVQ